MDPIVQGDLCRLHFRVKCKTKAGQAIGVSGSSYALGCSDRQNILHLVTSPESFPIWTTKDPVIVPRREIIYYRFCLVEGGMVKAFEKVDTPRMIMPEDVDCIVEDEFYLNKLEGFGQDSESKLFEQMRALTHRVSDMDMSEMLEEWNDSKVRSSRLFLVCYHLPVVVKRNRNPNSPEPFSITWSDSLIAKTNHSISNVMKTVWMGTISMSQKDLTYEEKEYLIVTLRTMDCIPVFLDDEITNKAYHGWCKSIIWPLFHNVDPLDHIHAPWNLHNTIPEVGLNASGGLLASGRARSVSIAEYRVSEWNKQEFDYFNAYELVNQQFARMLSEIVRENDIIWVHDYHLMLLPKLLREGSYNAGTSHSTSSDAQKRFNSGGLNFTSSGINNINSSSNTSSNVSNNQTHKENIFDHTKVIFFLHIPFPTSQIFRTLSKANILLHSITCADVVGFHAFDHARHFLNATKRMLGIRSYTRPGGMLILSVQEREVIVTMSHVSIETERIDAAMQQEETLQFRDGFINKYKGRHIIAGLDVCQRLSGVALKLAAFEKFLSDYLTPTGSNKVKPKGVVLIQRCIRQGSRVGDEATTSSELKQMVTDLNSKFASFFQSTQDEPPIVVDYEEVSSQSKEMTLNERLGLWLAADVFLLTPIREGLNLFPLEYIYARRDLPFAGSIIVSEFSTCSSLLNGSMKINPFAPALVADTILKAFTMTAKEAETRKQRDLKFISSHPSSLWTRQILHDLEQYQLNKGRARINPNKFPKPLDERLLLQNYEAASRDMGINESGSRLMIFDYGGTLLAKEKSDIYIKQSLSAIIGRTPSDSVMASLKKLSNDPRNIVMVVTGLTKMKLGDTFNDMKNITLATSNGIVYSWGQNLQKFQDNSNKILFSYNFEEDYEVSDTPTPESTDQPNTTSTSAYGRYLASGITNEVLSSPQPNRGRKQSFSNAASSNNITKDAEDSMNWLAGFEDGRQWQYLDFNINWDAVKEIALPIINKFSFRTNGTSKTPRIPGIGWSYFGADPEWGYKQAKQLKIELEASLSNFDIQVASLIQGSIELIPRKLNKGIIVKSLIDKVVQMRGGRYPGFVMVVGDEESDDKMIEALHEKIAGANANAELRRLKAFTISVSKRESPAHYYVNDVSHVESIINHLASSETTKEIVEESSPMKPVKGLKYIVNRSFDLNI